MNNPIVCVHDNFFKDFAAVEQELRACTFSDLTLSVDGVTYPYICEELPRSIEFEFLYKLQALLGVTPAPRFLFARAMPEGCHAPAKIHSDRDMGAYTAHVCFSGGHGAATSFLAGQGLLHAATSETTQADIEQDVFSKYLTVHHAPNRLLVHHAAHFHCAEPETGFGDLKKDSRLVITCFFDVL